MTPNELLYLPGILMLLSQSAVAGEYVPPPPGPYQSSVIINKDRGQSDSSGQVYKFPSDSLIHADKNKEPDYLNEQQIQTPIAEIKPHPAPVPKVSAPVRSKPSLPLPTLTQPANQADAGILPRNPWATDTLSYPDYYQGNAYPQNPYQRNWDNQQYSFPQQYPYGYNNQNNFMNNPFNSMPSPWSSMPMQPFLSDR